MNRIRSLILPPDMLSSVTKEGKHVPPLIRPRMAKLIRKKAILKGQFFEGADIKKGEWDPNWDKHNFHKAVVMREPNRSILERKRDDKVLKIEEAMKTMDQRVEEYRKSRTEGKPRSLQQRILVKLGYDIMGTKKVTKTEAKRMAKKDARESKKNKNDQMD